MVEKFALAIAITFSLNLVQGLSTSHSQSKTLPQLQQTPHQVISFLDAHFRP